MQGLWADTEQPLEAQSWDHSTPRESPATGSPTQPGAVSVLGCSRMFCERKPHVGALQGEPPPHL